MFPYVLIYFNIPFEFFFVFNVHSEVPLSYFTDLTHIKFFIQFKDNFSYSNVFTRI